MVVLQIEHPVPSFEGWKHAFDSDPVGRQRSGVRHHRVLRPINDPNYALIELEFDSVAAAETMLAALHDLWGRVEDTVMSNPQTRIVEIVETKAY